MSIESTRLTRWNFGLVALTLLGVSAIALAPMLPNSNPVTGPDVFLRPHQPGRAGRLKGPGGVPNQHGGEARPVAVL